MTEIPPGTRAIPLNTKRGSRYGDDMFAIVDEADYDHIAHIRWSVSKEGHNFYAVHTFRADSGKHGKWKLHRLIIPDAEVIDHINGNGLDNRRVNLRACTHAENSRNRRRQHNNRSGYTGVYFHKGNNGWIAQIKVNNQMVYLGTFATAEEASAARDLAARRYHGRFARLNNGGRHYG